MKDKTDRLLEAIEHPGRFTEEEIRAMLEDPEIRGLYAILCKTSDALIATNEPDIDKEWRNFNERSRVNKRRAGGLIRAFFCRSAAAAVLCAVASLAVVAATIGAAYSSGLTKNVRESPETTTLQAETAVSCDPTTDKVADDSEPPTVIFKDASLGSIMAEVAEFYGASAVYRSDKAKELRLYLQWDRMAPLQEVVDQLNYFEQIHITLSDSTLYVE